MSRLTRPWIRVQKTSPRYRIPAGRPSWPERAAQLNGITAWQMLHRSARGRRGKTILVHGASGGVGLLVTQLARQAGIRVIGTASPRNHDRLRELGAEPLDYHDPAAVDRRLRELAPGGVDAVLDNIGGPSFRRSFRQLARGGTLVGYGTASQRDSRRSMVLTFAGILAQSGIWTLRPGDGKRAVFYNFWAGQKTRPRRFRQHLAEDFARVLEPLAAKAITPYVAARFPLTAASEALTLADSGTVSGKIILTP